MRWLSDCSGFLWLLGLVGTGQLYSVLAQSTRYINAGGSDYFDGTNLWESDSGLFNSGFPYQTGAPIAGTNIDPLYQIERYSSGSLTYTIPISSGTYDVSLYFSEIYFDRTGARVFDVELEGSRVFTNLDIFIEAGNAAYTAVVKTVTDVRVSGGAMNLRLVKNVQNPKIQGIRIVPSTSSPTPSPGGGFSKFINAGSSSSYTDPRNNVWEADTGLYNTGFPFSTEAAISNTDLDPMYRKERYGEITYTIPGIPTGTYDVSLHFAEVYFNSVGSRVFDVKLEGSTAFSNLDVYREAGNVANRAVVKTARLPINDGNLVIELVKKTQNPKIQGIEIRSTSGTPTDPPPTPTPGPPDEFSKYINAGGSDYNDGTTIWEDDSGYYNLGSSYSTAAAISNTLRDPLYRVERWGQGLMYTIRGIPSGRYDVSLHFAEIYFDRAGARVFDVKLEGTTVVSGLDIYREAGKDAAVVKTVTNFPITDGSLDIDLVQRTQNPKIQGIEIVQVSGSSPTPSPPPGATWIDLNENQDYTARHECSFVQAGDRFYLFGGRESPTRMDTYDYSRDQWTRSASAPLSFNHFQAVEHEGLIWVIGSYKTNSFPNEALTEHVYVFDPANNAWMRGPAIPSGRRRGAGGLQVYNGKFYLVGGNRLGHNSGFVSWMDEYNPETAQWRQLPDAPHSRDHFHAAVIGSRLYAAGGRRTANDQENTFGDVVREVDVFDFNSETWLPSSSTPGDLPEPRAAAATAVFNGRVILAGGESLRSGSAHDDVHELNPSIGQWRRLDSLNFPRHGTQAIASGQGVYVAGGSDNRGAGNQKNMEVYNRDAPAGVASLSGTLSASSPADIDFGAPRPVTIQQTGGNQGIFVTSVSLTGSQASNFVMISGFPSPLLVPNGETHRIFVQYTGSQDNTQAQLRVVHSGGQVLTITLRGRRTGGAPSPTPPPPTSPLDIVDFIIVNAATDVDVGSTFGCNGCISSTTLMSIRAVPRESSSVGSVRLILTGPESRDSLENVAPYSLWGDNGGDYEGERLNAGTYTIRATAFSLSGGSGEVGSEASASFSVA